MTSSDLPKLWTTLSKISKLWVSAIESKLLFLRQLWSLRQDLFGNDSVMGAFFFDEDKVDLFSGNWLISKDKFQHKIGDYSL